MTVTYESLLRSRLNFRNNRAAGFEWNPVKLPYTPLVQETQGVPETVSRIIALALQLELPVGEWIGQATKKELPIDDIGRQLLLSNIADETVHYNAFKFAAEDYLKADHSDAAAVFAEWNTDEYHPILKACYGELGVFLVSLSALRLFGGESLSLLAANVSRDEMRHVSTNKTVLADLGHDFMTYGKINKLVNDTLDWMLAELTVPGLGKDFFIEQSRQLVFNGYAPELEALTNVADDYSPFESPNNVLY